MHYKHTTAAIIISLAAASECFAVQYLTVDEALKLSFPAMTSAENTDVLFSDEQKKKIEEELPDKLYINGQQIRKVFEQDHLLGFLFIDRVVGKHLLIDYSIALSPEGKVLRIEVLDYRESYGSEIRSRDWLSQFEGKDSKSSLEFNRDITNIGGATLSSRHVTDGVARVLQTFKILYEPAT